MLVTLAMLVTNSTVKAASLEKGSKNFTAWVGSAEYRIGNVEKYYARVELGGSYFVKDGLEVGASYRVWLGNSPTFQQISIPVNYYLNASQHFKPYIGAFVGHTFSSEDRIPGYDSYGGRVGIAITNGRAYYRAGIAQENYGDCDSNFRSCSEVYPEFAFGFSF